MNSVGDTLIGSKYALYCPKHGTYSTIGDLVLFADGSSANLSDGFIDNKSPDKEMIIVPLADGINHFKFGKENESPKTVNGLVTNLEINYPGVVHIIPADNETSVQENARCFATIDGQTLRVTPAKVTEFTYTHMVTGNLNFTSLGNSSQNGTEIPILKIYTPDSVNVTGSCKALKFDKLAHINVTTSSLSGKQAESVNVVGLKVIDCPKILSELTINSTSSVEIASQLQCPKVFIDNTSSLNIQKAIHTNTLTIRGNSSVNIETVYASVVDIKRTSRVEIKNGIVGDLKIKTTSGITVHLYSCDSITIESTSGKDITIDHGETTVSITKSTSRVNLKLDIAKDIAIETSSRVDITAKKYLKIPVVKTSSKVSIQ